MYEEAFCKRLAQLRMLKGVSARDMSLSIGQNAGYINNIENGKALPSMANFFYICDYLEITPMDFFDFESSRPKEAATLYSSLNKLSDSQFNNIREIITDLVKNK
ncbi:MAG: helix-turn-helix transcriptional regulator [Lachnospiraceae bacterium]|nr:helix-turn-helix transcriptional regulator [Lachnospiraceae bacterium]